MGTPERKPHPALIERLLREPGAFEFFRAVQLLEQSVHTGTRRRARPVGHDHPAGEAGVGFRAAPALAFPTRPVVAVQPRDDGAHDVLVSFLGLVGPAGVLPAHYTETVLQRAHSKDFSPRDFIDVLQDRSIAFFYRVWKKYRLPVAYAGKEAAASESDPITTALLALAGILPRSRGEALAGEELAQIHHAGLFSDRRRSAHGLRAMLRGLLGCEVAVEQFVGQWIDLDPDARSRLGGSGSGVQARLGEETVLGARVWSVDARIRVVAGPLDRARFRELWPGGAPVRLLWGVLRAYLGPLIECDLVWKLAPDAPVPMALGGDQRLGRDAWLGWSEFGGPDLRVGSPPWHNPRPGRLGAEHMPELHDPKPNSADRRPAAARSVTSP
jgi:type VI secretion system protein ImpH